MNKLLLTLFIALPLCANITITSPAANSTQTGAFNFRSTVTGLPAVSTVEYLVNNHRVFAPIAAPYTYAWHAAYVWNGVYTVVAVARDATGAEVTRSAPVKFTVSQPGITGALTLTSPADPTIALSGTVTFTASLTPNPLPSGFDRMLITVDGTFSAPIFAYTATQTIDTTTLANGPHEILFTAFGGVPGSGAIVGRALLFVPITVNNGSAPQQLRSNYKNVYLTPGQTVTLTARTINTDNTAATAAGSFSSDNAAAATVGASSGIVTAVATGVANITIRASGRTTVTKVVIDPAHGFPHFSKSGAILQSYDPANSLFLRAVHLLGVDFATQTPGLAAEMGKAAVNVAVESFYSNPAEGDRPPTFAAWKAEQDTIWAAKVNFAGANNLSMFLLGDGMARNPVEMDNSNNGSFGPQAVQYALTIARDSGRSVAIDMIDEASYVWGITPTPAAGSAKAIEWAGYAPPIPVTAFSTLLGTINGVPNRTPISWPVFGTDGSAAAVTWMTAPFANYGSHYSSYQLANEPVYPWSVSFNQDRADRDYVIDDRLRVMDRTRPQLILSGLTGSGYQKNGPGSAFVPGQDTIQGVGNTPALVTAQIMYTLLKGGAGNRAYDFDRPAWQAQRASSPVGSGFLQTGANPFGQGADRWAAMSNAYNFIKRFEADILQPQINAPDLGPDLMTSARSGPNSRILIAANYSEAPRTETINLQPYIYSTATGIERHRISSVDNLTDIIASGASTQQTIQPGETVVWAFRANTQLVGTTGNALTVTVTGTTPTQAAMTIRGASGACTLELSTSPSYIPVVPDVNGVQYPGASLDTGRPDTFTWADATRVVTLGHQTGDRALQQDTQHYWRVSGCGAAATGSFKTSVPGVGTTSPPAVPFNIANWGNSGYPTVDWTQRSQTLIDPLTGIRLKPINVAGDWGWTFGPTSLGYAVNGAAWTSTGTGILNGSTSSYATAGTTNPIDVYADTVAPFDDPWGTGAYPRSLDDLGLVVFGSGTSATDSDRQFTACVFLNPVDGCIGTPIVIALPAGPVAKVPSPGSDVDGAWPGNFPAAELAGWGNALIRRENFPTYGTLSASGGVLSIATPTASSHFPTTLKAGSRIFISGSEGVCANALCTIASITDPAHAAISESLTIANAPYKCFGWGIRIAKANAGGTINVGLQIKAAGSSNLKVAAEDLKCDPLPVRSGDGITGHACFLYAATNTQAFLYFLGDEGTTRRISALVIPASQTNTWPVADQPGGALAGAQAPYGFDGTRGNVFYARLPTTGGKTSIFSLTYTGDWTNDLDFNYTGHYDGSFPPTPFDQITWANVMPPSQNRDLASLVAAAYPAYDSTLYGGWSNSNLAGISAGSALFYIADNGGQDAGPGWVAAVDLAIPAVTMVLHTLDGSGVNSGNATAVQWATLHSAATLSNPAKWAEVSGNMLAASNSNLLLGGPFQVAPNAVLRSGSFSSNTALPWPPDSSYDNTCPAGNAFTSLGATGNTCVTFLFPGNPCNIAPNATERTRFPACNWNNAFTQPVALAPGMLVTDPGAPGQPDAERFRIISVTPAGGGALNVVAQRNATPDYCCVAGTRPTCQGSPSQSTHLSGWIAQMSPGSTNSCATARAIIDLPTNSFYVLGRLFGGHYDINHNGSNINYVTSGAAKYNIPVSQLAALPTTFTPINNPIFGDALLGSVTGLIGSNLEQGYASASQYAAPQSDSQWMLDTNPVNPVAAVGTESLANGIAARTLTHLSANVYDIQIVGLSPGVPYNPKLTPLFGWAGRFILQDISGPTSNIAAAPDYSMCYAFNTGECLNAGVQGHAYVRVPFAYDTGYCVSSQSWANIPCVMVGLPAAGSYRQQQISQADPNGLGSRFLSYLGFGPGRESIFSKAVVHPSGKWGVVPAPGWTDGVRMLGYLLEIPRWQSDSVTRNTFERIQVDIPASGTRYAEVQFGYSRYGGPGQFYCTPRAEACNTSSAASTPFSFEGESRVLTACPNGCTISIPALSGNLLYYRVRHSADGVSWSNGDTLVRPVQ